MESKKINQLATELAPDLSDLTIIGDPTTGISKKITLSQMASLFTGTVEEYANFAAFPLVGVADTIYIALDTNILYRWNTGTSAYVELSPNIVSSLVFNDANGFDGTINLVGSVATLTITTALTTGSVGFIGASGALLQDNANFFWDDTNNRLGLGTNAPTTALDVFGSGIIGRLNATSTNNAYLGFSSAGTNKWSIGNVQSDHRFRIYNEATTSELVSVLSTGEFGIGIANPTTKFHIDGAASALIANLDANVSVAKSISFRSDNSNRINLEVSGTESGSDAGANFFLRAYSDAGALLNTPLTITRATGAAAFVSTISAVGATFTDNVLINNSASLSKLSIKGSGSTTGLELYVLAANATISNQDNGSLAFQTNGTNRLTIASTGASTFSTNVNIDGEILTIGGTSNNAVINNIASVRINIDSNNNDTGESFTIGNNQTIIDNNNVLFRVQENGNVGIGTSSPNRLLDVSSGGDTYLRVTGNRGNSDDLHVSNVEFYNSNSTRIIAEVRAITGTGGTQSNSGQLAFYTNNAGTYAEKMRLSSKGYLKVTSTGTYNDLGADNHEFINGTINNNSFFVANTNTSYAAATLVRINCNRTTTNGTYNLIGATNGNSTGEFLVRDSGNVLNTNNSYTGTSDIKLKQDIIDANSQWDDIKQMRIRKFRFKKQVEQDENAPYLLGVIAQELELVSPNLVDETLDFDGTGEEVASTTKSVKYSIIYMKAVKALQEAMEKIEILEEKVKQLELK